MAGSQSQDLDRNPHVDEIPERLDEQHVLTTKTLGFLIHPNIQITSPTAKIADIGAGSGAWLLDVAKSLPPTCHFVGYDLMLSGCPAPETLPSNVSFQAHDMFLPFPAAELGTYDLVATRFTSSVLARADFARAITNLLTLLKPGGWLQWIDSCNFALYNSTAGSARVACQTIYDGMEPFRRNKIDPVIGLMMREAGNVRRPETLRELGLVEVHEDVFSTDRLQDLKAREQGTWNIMICFLQCLEDLAGSKESEWTMEKVEKLKAQAKKEVEDGVYHTLDQVCIIGRKANGP